MKIGDLKKLIAAVPDDVEVVLTGRDHHYSRVGRGSKVVKAEDHGGGARERQDLAMYYGEEHRGSRTSRIVVVFWIDDGRY
jgi:hypothetical protein